MNSPVSFEDHGNIAVITVSNPPVNALSQPVRQGLWNAIDILDSAMGIDAAVLICQGRTFVAGADIKEFGKPPLEPFTPVLMRRIGACKKPIVAALHGTVLGGGFELALACHFRVARSDTQLGFPEVNLGLIPGAGGTQLLPRLAGVPLALDMITSGRRVSVESVEGRRLVDRIVDSASHNELLEEAVEAARTVASEKDVRRLSDADVPDESDLETLLEDWRASMKKKKPGELAALTCIDSIENAVKLPFDDGAAEEQRLFQACRESSQSRALRHAFFAEKQCLKVDDIDPEAKARPIQQVGVIGSGWMGVGIATCFANTGLAVTLLDVNEETVTAGVNRVLANFQRSEARGRITSEERQARSSLVKGTTDYTEFAKVDLVVEAAVEDMAIKREIFQKLDSVCQEQAILATNTSYLDINEIASATDREDRVVGMHFFSPAYIMKLLEVVRAEKTSDETLVSIISLGKRLGKVPVTVGVGYGFAGNRIYARYGAEAQNLLLEGATPDQVDSAMREWGMAMGPLQVVDLTGLDIGYKARKHQPNLPDDPTYFALSTVFVEQGRLGQKTDAGFYRYQDGVRSDDEESIDLIRRTAQRLGISQRDFDNDEICKRLLTAIVDESRTILNEEIVQRSSDIDAIWLNGYGFPRYRGGPMWYADEAGL
ncbi:MAG: 3-hydroxyacyl-CoA dehydrogenase NAD-binding domain-containing protein [Pseudomonadota bacterium]